MTRPLDLLAGSLAELSPPRADPQPAAPADRPQQRLLSAREAARRLGVSRGRTIATLIDSGRLRVVTVNGRVRIPATEIDRLAREGLDVRQSPPRCRRRGQTLGK